MEQADHYAVLGVSPASDDVVIRAAYKALMLKYHPDANSDAGATARAAQINAAFAILGDPGKRAAYDASARAADSAPPTPPPPAPPARDAGAGSARSWTRRVTSPWGISLILALIVGGIRYAAIHQPAPASADTYPMDVSASDTRQMSSSALQDEPSVVGGVVNTAQTEMPAPVQAGFSSPTPVDFHVIEAAAGDFDRVLAKQGMIGARAASEACHRKVQKAPVWADADRCAAFDFAASYIDGQVARSGNWPMNNYFAFQAVNQADNYRRIGGEIPWDLQQRLNTLRTGVQPEVAQVISARLSREEAQRPQAATPAGDDAEASLENS